MCRRCVPYLKSCCRGAGWEDNHWHQLFTMLGLKTTGPKAVTKETVTLAHFLDVADMLIKFAEKIKLLDAQAQGEAVLRKALNELKFWGLQREFELSNPAAAAAAGAGPSPALIKEWRDVLTEVGDHQSLVASLKQSKYYNMFKVRLTSRSWGSCHCFSQLSCK